MITPRQRRNRLAKAFSKETPCLICYAPIGDPLVSPTLLDIYADSGVDIAEVGIPSPRPYLDGPIVSQSMARALEAGATEEAIAETIARFREGSERLATVWFCYPDANLSRLEDWAKRSILDGLMMVDAQTRSNHLQIVSVLEEQMVGRPCFVSFDVKDDECAKAAEGDAYVMLQARPGKTGIQKEPLDPSLKAKIQALEAAGVSAPIVLGIGISELYQIQDAIEMGADGVVIGSACVRAATESDTALKTLLGRIRKALS